MTQFVIIQEDFIGSKYFYLVYSMFNAQVLTEFIVVMPNESFFSECNPLKRIRKKVLEDVLSLKILAMSV